MRTQYLRKLEQYKNKLAKKQTEYESFKNNEVNKALKTYHQRGDYSIWQNAGEKLDKYEERIVFYQRKISYYNEKTIAHIDTQKLSQSKVAFYSDDVPFAIAVEGSHGEKVPEATYAPKNR